MRRALPVVACGWGQFREYWALPAALRPALRPLQLSCEVSYHGERHGDCWARLPFWMALSDGDTEGAEEYQHLGGDAVDGAVDDADDGDREATRNIGHGNTSYFRGWVKRTWNKCPAAVTSVTLRRCGWCAQTLGDAVETPLSFLDRAHASRASLCLGLAGRRRGLGAGGLFALRESDRCLIRKHLLLLYETVSFRFID